MENFTISRAVLLLISFSIVVVADLRGNYNTFVNSAWEVTSTPSGPGDVALMGPSTVVAGKNYNFTCQTICNPPCNFTWLFNGVIVTSGVRQISMHPANLADNGVITCQAQNRLSLTMKAVSKVIRVIDPNNTVSVKPTLQNPPNVGQPYGLKCLTTGNATAALWVKNNLVMSTNSKRIQLLDNNTVLLFDPLTMFDNAIYQCLAFVEQWTLTSGPLVLRVNYGPGNIAIIGPSELIPSYNYTFSCSAISYPPSNYTWYLDDSEVAQGNVYEVTSAILAKSSTLTCTAQNAVTGLKVTNSVDLNLMNGATSCKICSSSLVAALALLLLQLLPLAS